MGKHTHMREQNTHRLHYKNNFQCSRVFQTLQSIVRIHVYKISNQDSLSELLPQARLKIVNI